MSNTLPLSPSSKTSNCTSAQVQELNDLKQFYKIQYEKYKKYKILFEAVRETAFTSNLLEPELKLKVQDIMLYKSCADVINLNGNGASVNSNTLLGVTNFNSNALNFSESVKLKKAVELLLNDQYKNLCEQFSKITSENINMVPSSSNDSIDLNLSGNDQTMFDLKGKLQQQQEKYVYNLFEEQRIMQDMVNLRLNKVPQICVNKVMECQVKSQMSSLQSRIVQEKARVEIFTETSNSLPAYVELMKDIKIQQQECRKDIQYLEDLKQRYKQVSCKQYDEMLKTFIQYKSSLAKKKIIYESLQC